MNEHVTLKLINGDQLMCELLSQTEHLIYINKPITIKLSPVMTEGTTVERLLTSVYCPVSDQETFVLDTRHVIYVNRLHPRMVKHYKTMSDELYTNLKNPLQYDLEEKEDNLEKPDISGYH